MSRFLIFQVLRVQRFCNQIWYILFFLKLQNEYISTDDVIINFAKDIALIRKCVAFKELTKRYSIKERSETDTSNLASNVECTTSVGSKIVEHFFAHYQITKRWAFHSQKTVSLTTKKSGYWKYYNWDRHIKSHITVNQNNADGNVKLNVSR